jgi:hypothetical protein
MPLAAWLLSLVAPFVIRGVIALGFTAVTFTGVTVLANQLIDIAKSSWSVMPLVVLQIASLSGIPESLGMIAGAYVARLGVWAAVNGTKYVMKA